MKFGFTRREIKPVTKEQEAEFAERMKEEKVGFKDGFAMVFAALFTIVLPCLLVLGGLSLLILWLFGAF